MTHPLALRIAARFLASSEGKTVTETIYGAKHIPASEITEKSANGLSGVWIDAKHYRRYDATLKRGKWVLDGNWSPNYKK